MGCRSDVVIRVEMPEQLFKEEQIKMLLTKPYWLSEIQSIAREFDSYLWTEGHILLHATSWKWYDSYEIVQACNTMFTYFEELGEDNIDVHGCYLRVGEDSDDVMEEYFNEGSDLAYIDRSIEIN